MHTVQSCQCGNIIKFNYVAVTKIALQVSRNDESQESGSKKRE